MQYKESDIIKFDRKDMVRKIYYLHDFEIRILRIEQSYIDYQLSQNGFNNLRDVILFELEQITGRNTNYGGRGSNSGITVCYRPYIQLAYSNNEILKHWIDVGYTNFFIDKGENLLFDSYNKFGCYDVIMAANNCFKNALFRLQQIGLKKELKQLHEDKKFDIIHGLITKQIKEYETSK